MQWMIVFKIYKKPRTIIASVVLSELVIFCQSKSKLKAVLGIIFTEAGSVCIRRATIQLTI
jgi:hypothetical protein